jgi:DNA processing protein
MSVRAVLWRVCAIIPGPRTFRALINHFGGARAAIQALPTVARRGGANGAAQICSRADAEREFAAAKRLGVALVALGEPDYPLRLQMIDDAPPVLAIRGHAPALALPWWRSSARAMRRAPE